MPFRRRDENWSGSQVSDRIRREVIQPLESLVATIHQGRPGTPMPGWAPLISAADARWIAEQLQRGFPESP